MGFVHRGAAAREISFPLGGLGTGSIGLAGNGALIDWEIYNRPNKGSRNGPSHFAIRAEREGRVVAARVLHGDLAAPYSGELAGENYRGFGFGAPRDSLAGLPHFREVEFAGTYPLASLSFADNDAPAGFPGEVRMTAFNPLIPHNDRDSGIPAAFFEIEVRNTTAEPLAYTLALVVRNPLASGARNRFARDGGVSLVRLDSESVDAGDPAFGDLTIATDAAAVSYQEYLYRGRWFDNLAVYWQDLTKAGPFANRRYAAASGGRKQYSGEDIALLAAHLDVEPGDVRSRALRDQLVLSQLHQLLEARGVRLRRRGGGRRRRGRRGGGRWCRGRRGRRRRRLQAQDLEELLRHALPRLHGERPLSSGQLGAAGPRDPGVHGCPLREHRSRGGPRRGERQHLDPQVADGAAPRGRHVLRLGRLPRPRGLLRRAAASTSGTTPTRCRSCSPPSSARCATRSCGTTSAPRAT